jgi:hypothetical protein
MSGKREREVAILGAGPIGLEAALAAEEAGLPFTVYEAAPAPAANVRAWGHVRLFTPWSMIVSPRMRRRLEAAGLPLPDGDECPTGRELVDRVLAPLFSQPGIRERLELGSRVVAVGREGVLKHEEIGAPERRARRFRLLLADARGRERIARADVVLDCTGSYGHPNTLGDGGIPAPGERELGPEVVREIPDLATGAARWEGRTTLLVGAGHSAQTAAGALAELALDSPNTRVVWALRREAPDWKAVENDPLLERARLTSTSRELASGGSPSVECRTGVVVEEVEREDGGFFALLRDGGGGVERVAADRILSLTGAVGDHGIYRQLQVHECYATSGPMKLSAALLGSASQDCLDQVSHGADVLVNPEPDFFILGEKSYGRNNTFLMSVGWSQVDEVFGLLAGSDA